MTRIVHQRGSQMTVTSQIEQVRERPIATLTAAEIAVLSDQERRWVIAQLARWEAKGAQP